MANEMNNQPKGVVMNGFFSRIGVLVMLVVCVGWAGVALGEGAAATQPATQPAVEAEGSGKCEACGKDGGAATQPASQPAGSCGTKKSCGKDGDAVKKAAHHHKHHGKHHGKHAWKKIDAAVAVLHPTEGNTTRGVVRFTRTENGVKVVADVEGLTPGAMHAIHIHEFGDGTASNGTSAGGHYNPAGHAHGAPADAERHAGDLGNLQADGEGRAHYELEVDNISICGHKSPILGRGVIVHAKADDFGQPTGNAGARIACGVIGIANPAAQ